jgi:hypothetical protein
MLSIHLRLGLTSGLFPSGFPPLSQLDKGHNYLEIFLSTSGVEAREQKQHTTTQYNTTQHNTTQHSPCFSGEEEEE